MDALGKVFSSVKKTSNGFEDLEEFWAAADKLSIPSQGRLREKFFSSLLSNNRLKTQLSSSSSGIGTPMSLTPNPTLPSSSGSTAVLQKSFDTDFDYDTSSTISDTESIFADHDNVDSGEDESLAPLGGRPSITLMDQSHSTLLPFSDEVDEEEQRDLSLDSVGSKSLTYSANKSQSSVHSAAAPPSDVEPSQTSSRNASAASSLGRSKPHSSPSNNSTLLGSSSLLLNMSPLFGAADRSESSVDVSMTPTPSFAYSQDSLLPFSDSPSILPTPSTLSPIPLDLSIASPPKAPVNLQDTADDRAAKSLLMTPSAIISTNLSSVSELVVSAEKHGDDDLLQLSLQQTPREDVARSTGDQDEDMTSPPLLLSSLKKSGRRKSNQRVSFEGLELSPIEHSVASHRKSTGYSMDGDVSSAMSSSRGTARSSLLSETSQSSVSLQPQSSVDYDTHQSQSSISKGEDGDDGSLTVSETSDNEVESSTERDLSKSDMTERSLSAVDTDSSRSRSRSRSSLRSETETETEPEIDGQAETEAEIDQESSLAMPTDDSSMPVDHSDDHIAMSMDESHPSAIAPTEIDDHMDHTDHMDQMDYEEDDLHEQESMSRLVSSQIESPLGPSPAHRSRPTATYRTTPKSNRLDDSMITTPGSSEFPRGFQLHDSTFLASSDDDDNAVDTDRLINQSQNSDDDDDNGHKHGSDTEGHTEGEVSMSFVDKSYLHTIDQENPTYAGKEILAETKRQHHAEMLRMKEHQQRKRAKKKRLLGLSDSDEDGAGPELDDDQSAGMDSDAEWSHDSSDRIAEEQGFRRSHRATKGRRLQYWKGERCVYNEGTLVGITQAAVTPAKKPRLKRMRKTKTVDNDDNDADIDFDKPVATAAAAAAAKQANKTSNSKVRLPTDVEFLPAKDSCHLSVWDNVQERPERATVVCLSSSLGPPRALPAMGDRPPGKEKVGYALPLLSAKECEGLLPSWTAGFIDLPPHAIKDAEGVGQYAQLFFVSQGQAGSLEFGLADPREDYWRDDTAQRVLLGEGDSFFVPPGNIYRLENHSDGTTVKLHWVIIMPMSDGDRMRGSSVSEGTAISGEVH